jgi:glycosyltransferase involved in cell wall biosynthesis
MKAPADTRIGWVSRFLAPPPSAEVEPLPASPTFSVVIAAYQAAETIATAVRSALEQNLPAHEVIVVDDGSSDNLESALAPFRDRILLIRQENRGAAAARNTAAAAASGEFVVVLDADDAYHPLRLEALGQLGRSRPDLDLITTDARLVVDGKGVGTFATYTPFVIEDQRTAIFESCFVGGWPAIRLSRLREIGGFDETLRVGEDWDCWLRAILAGAAAGMVDEPYYDYVLHANTLSASRAPNLWARVRLLEKARRNTALRPGEKPSLERALRMHRSRAVMAEVQDALYGSGPRLPLARYAIARRIEPRTRLMALLGTVAPPLARRVVPEYRAPEERLAEVAE